MKSILITGASSGIGRALAVRAARAGYLVYAVGRNATALAGLAAEVAEDGGTLASEVCDVSEPANAPGLVARALSSFARIDILVNNAGTVAVGPIALQSDEELRVQFGTHVIGPLALVREALPALRAVGGHVFMLGSGVARVPIGGLGAYPPSKAALRSATAILRRELDDLGVAVTYVDPGAVDTAFMRRAGMPGAPESLLVAPEEVARKILLAVYTRQRTLNVAPLQTAAVTLAELLPAVTEAILDRNPAIAGTQTAHPALATVTQAAIAPPPADAPRPEADEAQIVDVGTPAEVDVGEPSTELIAQIGPEEGAPGGFTIPFDQTTESAAASLTFEAAATWDGHPAPESPAEAAPVPLSAHAAGHEGEPALDELPAGPLPIEADDDHDAPVSATNAFDAALGPLARRMERARFDPAFVRGLLVPEAIIDVSEVALRWAGMPNKHERALTNEVFFALAESGFLAPRSDGRYRVVRSAS